jgi:hypothetical protein
MHAVTAPTPWGRMPALLPKTRAPGGDALPHGGADIRTQARPRVEHRLVERPVGLGTNMTSL